MIASLEPDRDRLAAERGWLDPQSTLPTLAQIVAVLAGSAVGTDAVAPLAKRSSVEPFAERIRQWFEQGVQIGRAHV